jgi:AraC family transcriptional regulator
MVDHDTFRRLCRSRDFLAASFGERLRLEQAAARAYLSPFHYHRLFRRAFGETPHEFLTRLRLDEAKRLLAAGERSILPSLRGDGEIGRDRARSLSVRMNRHS